MSLEITDPSVTGEQLRDAWPDVTYKGQDLFDVVYCDEGVYGNEQITRQLPSQFQECYLGYDRTTDLFVVGYDCWHDEPDYYDDEFDEDYAEDPTNTFSFRITNGKLAVITPMYSGTMFYNENFNRVHRHNENLIDLRLD